MSCTKIGRIRKLIKKLEAHGPTYEASKPRQTSTQTTTITTFAKESGAKIKTKSEIVIIDNTYGRTDRRNKQLEILKKISKDHKNDGHFRVKKSLGTRKQKAPKIGTGKKKKK